MRRRFFLNTIQERYDGCVWMQVFVTAHQSVADVSKQMLQELKRHNYVTPTNYLETVRGYRYIGQTGVLISSILHASQAVALHLARTSLTLR